LQIVMSNVAAMERVAEEAVAGAAAARKGLDKSPGKDGFRQLTRSFLSSKALAKDLSRHHIKRGRA
jgi:hypothetical protein